MDLDRQCGIFRFFKPDDLPPHLSRLGTCHWKCTDISSNPGFTVLPRDISKWKQMGIEPPTLLSVDRCLYQATGAPKISLYIVFAWSVVLPMSSRRSLCQWTCKVFSASWAVLQPCLGLALALNEKGVINFFLWHHLIFTTTKLLSED